MYSKRLSQVFKRRKAFTLLEVLISIMLLSLVLMALYKSSEILNRSNKNLFNHLDSTSNYLKGGKTLYMDIIQADEEIFINTENKFHQLTIEKSKHSLYGLEEAKITWLVYKENNTLLRIEGNDYKLPLQLEDNVAIDTIATDVEVFKVYMSKKSKKMLVVLKIAKQESQTFMIQNLSISLKIDQKNDIIGGSKNTSKNNK